MALKLALASESQWRGVNAPHLLALVRAGIRYPDGAHVSAPEAHEQ
jgi:putative transposase